MALPSLVWTRTKYSWYSEYWSVTSMYIQPSLSTLTRTVIVSSAVLICVSTMDPVMLVIMMNVSSAEFQRRSGLLSPSLESRKSIFAPSRMLRIGVSMPFGSVNSSTRLSPSVSFAWNGNSRWMPRASWMPASVSCEATRASKAVVPRAGVRRALTPTVNSSDGSE